MRMRVTRAYPRACALVMRINRRHYHHGERDDDRSGAMAACLARRTGLYAVSLQLHLQLYSDTGHLVQQKATLSIHGHEPRARDSRPHPLGDLARPSHRVLDSGPLAAGKRRLHTLWHDTRLDALREVVRGRRGHARPLSRSRASVRKVQEVP